jgi:hypothetical protein
VSEIAPNKAGGFATAVLTQKREAKPIAGKASSFSETAKKRGLLLVSKDSPDNPLPEKQGKTKLGSKTRNRKTVTTDDHFTHNGISYRVNAKKSGLYVQPLKRMIEQFEIAASLWSRVMVLRFDLHQDFYTKDSKRVSDFVKRINTKLKREYGLKKIGFCWAREQEKAKAQHYHFVLFLEGRRVRQPKRLIEIIKQAWESPLGGHHMPYISRPSYFGTRNEIADKVIYRISYLAKARGKGYRPEQNKDYQCSRMKITRVAKP